MMQHAFNSSALARTCTTLHITNGGQRYVMFLGMSSNHRTVEHVILNLLIYTNV